MKKRETQFNTNPYCEIFRGVVSDCHTNASDNKLLGFTVYYNAKDNKMSNGELLDWIMELSPPPHSVYPDKEGFLARFELDNPFGVEDEEHEKSLRERIVKFFEDCNIAKGILQEIEIGIWDSRLILIDDASEVREWR